MADNPEVRAGTAGGTIVVAADEVTIYGSAAQIQGVKIHDGLESGTIGARVNSSGQLVVHQANNGTVSVTGTPNVHVTNSGTVSVSNTVTVDSELPTAAALADNTSNPTVPGVGAFAHVFDGTNWDRAPGNTAAGALVHQTNNGTVSVSNTVTVDGSGVTQPVSHAALTELAAAIDTELQVDVVAALPAGTNNIGDVDVLTLPGGITGKAEDDPHSSGDVGIPAMAVRKNEAAALAGADADYTPLISGPTGALWTHVAAGTVVVSSSGLPSGAATLAEQQTQTTSLSVIDDWDESDRAKVNIVVGQAGVTAGAGGVAANTPRVTLASDDPAVAALQILDNAISGSEMQVDVVAALPAGTNNIGDVDVASIAAGDNNIGNVDAIQSGTWTVQPGNTQNTTPWLVKDQRSATGTCTQVNDTASSTTLLASNANRLGCSIQNTSSAVLYIKTGTTASATDFTARLVQYAYWEAPFGYTGRIDGIWATDPGDGAAVITEFT